MSILDNILNRTAAPLAKAAPARAEWLRASASDERWTMPDTSSVDGQATLYTKVSWVRTAVKITSQSAAGVPFQVKMRKGENTEAIDNHPFEVKLQSPNPEESRFEFLEATFAWYMISGNAYWWLNRTAEDQEPSELWVIPSRQIMPVPDGNMGIRGYLYDAGQGQRIPLEPWEVCHFKTFNPFSRYLGLSAVEAFRVSAYGDLSSNEWNTNFFARDNAKTAGILAFADPYTQPDWERMQDDFKRQAGGTKNKRLLMLRNVGKGGVEFISTQLSQKDMEFLQLRQFTKEEIWGDMAPGLASMLAVNATEANSKTGVATMNERAIWPMHRAIGEKVSLRILPAYGTDLIGEFDDVRHRDQAAEQAMQGARQPYWTVNELRAEEGKEALDGELWEKIPAAAALRVFAPDMDGAYTGLTLIEKAPPVVPMLPPAPPQLTATDVPLEPTDAAPIDEAAVAPEDAMMMGKAEDLRKWERKALKRLRSAQEPFCGFESDYLTDDEQDAIKAALRAAQSAEDVRQAFKADGVDALIDEHLQAALEWAQKVAA